MWLVLRTNTGTHHVLRMHTAGSIEDLAGTRNSPRTYIPVWRKDNAQVGKQCR